MLQREEHIAKLIFLHVQGLADETQERELAAWRAMSERHEAVYQRMASEAHVERSLARFVRSGEEEERNWQALRKEMEARDKRKNSKRVRWISSAAAVAVMVLTVGGMLWYGAGNAPERAGVVPVASSAVGEPGSHAILILPDGRELDLKSEVSRNELAGGAGSLLINDKSLTYGNVEEQDTTEVYHTLVVPRGGEYVLTLSDSTVVYLNAESRLTYPVAFNGKNRKVELSGEAYFKVKRDETKPFVVHAQQMEVLVLGTTFGVRAYQDENEIQTTLESGKVRVRAGKREVNLVPNEQARFDKSTSSLDVREVDAAEYWAWKNGRLVYDNCSLERILTDLSRWYGFVVFYSRDESRAYKFSLNMKKHEVFSQVLELIEKAGDIDFEVKDNTVVVK